MYVYNNTATCFDSAWLAYSMPMDSRETLTTRRSKMLKELRQKEPL